MDQNQPSPNAVPQAILKRPRVAVVQRCAAYGYWPEITFVQSRPITLTGATIGASPLKIRIGFLGYRNRANYLDEAKTINCNPSFSFFQLAKKAGFWEGRKNYIENNNGDPVGTIEYRHPIEGQIDLYLSVEGDEQPDIPAVHNALKSYLSILINFLSFKTSDILVPTTEVETQHTTEKNTNAYGGRNEINLVLKPRQRITTDQIVAMFGEFSKLMKPVDAETVRRIDVAGRRILTGKSEMDDIDKFSDFWEACEILCPRSRTLKGLTDHRISVRLAQCIGLNHHEIKIRLVGPLYDIRKDLVHSAVDSPDLLKSSLPNLEEIANQLLRDSIGVSGVSSRLLKFFQKA